MKKTKKPTAKDIKSSILAKEIGEAKKAVKFGLPQSVHPYEDEELNEENQEEESISLARANLN